jgi:cyanophycinase
MLQMEFPPTHEAEESFLSNLAHHPRCVGVGLEAGTWMLLQNRKIRVVGDGFGKFLLAPGTYPSARVHSIRDTVPKVKELDKVLVDLTQWRREAIDRTLPLFPPKDTVQPIVKNGHLLIVGGGGLPSGLMDRFVELAGGIDNAKLVYVPCEEDDQVAEKHSTVEMWKRMGVKNATYIHTKDRNQANEDDSFLKPLVSATGIWFGGGRQWNLADSYYGTKAHRLMKQCVERGGVIGGSSAGASIQAAYLARATPIENFQIMAPGYERGGLGFLQGVAIDQHFSQRNRIPDMSQLVKTYPQLLGIGIDETTAIEVSASTAIVSGNGSVYFFDGTKRSEDDSPSFVKLRQGDRYDLIQRSTIRE